MFKTKEDLDPMSGNKLWVGYLVTNAESLMANANVRISNGSVLSNPNVSEEVKAHVVDQDVGDDQAHK